MHFDQLNLIKPILSALTAKGYQTPTPIQEKSIPIILQRQDLLGCAQTGTGKTAAFAIPMLQILDGERAARRWPRGIKALVLTPTRELAVQIEENFAAYGNGLGLRQAVIFGGVNQHGQVKKLRAGVDILVATPGRLMDLMEQGYIDLRDLKIFVLDEADRMLDMGFIHDIQKIIKVLPPRRQSLFFSATMPPTIQELAGSLLYKPAYVEVAPVSSTTESVQQHLYLVEKDKKRSLLLHLLKDPATDSALVFTRTKHGADKVAKFLTQSGIRTEAIHGNKSQNARQMALKNFKSRHTRVLIATDIAARGIDIHELSHVINFEIPNEPETYVHRIGRTGRASCTGVALSLCDITEQPFIRSIQKLIGKDIPIIEDHPYASATQLHSPSGDRPRGRTRRFRSRARGR